MKKRVAVADDAEAVEPAVALHDPHEVARFLRPQPPWPIPPRTYATPLPGLLALALLGARVVTRFQRD